jgi:hypothetical protein
MGLLMSKKLNPTGLWAWVWGHSTQTYKPMGFLNPVYHNILLAIYLYKYRKILLKSAQTQIIKIEKIIHER